ncbi:MAG: SDR family oxidoreductase [Candidatus Omnitrophica bacterium]|nr:SDR family oxidoreductase [Candidatus Omnitrophota bacterium]
MKKTVLITGGAGFIGSHLCFRLTRSGYRVVCVDNLITGSRRNINALLNDKNFVFIRQDVSRLINFKSKVDYVFHCASLASPEYYLRYPVETLKVGSFGTCNALDLARKNRAVFMLFSTSEIYGDPLVHPQKENYWGNVNTIGVRGCYDESKRFAEALTMAYHRIYKLNTRIVRIFNTYGPGMRADDGRVVPNFINQALNNKPLTVYGKGEQTRSFCFVDDLVEGLCRLMLKPVHEPVNLGNPNEFTIMQLADAVLKLTNSQSKIIFKSLPQDDPRQRQPDIHKAKVLLGWEPKISLQEGLARTIPFFLKSKFKKKALS